MERKKSVFACIFISAAMIFLTLSAYATSGDGVADAGTNQSPVISVTLPTSNYKFTIDPYGLTTMDGSGKSLEEVMANPPGLVTSEALAIKNNNTDLGVQIDVELYLSSNSPIKIAKTREEAENGAADLYLQIKPTGGSAEWAPTPVTVLGDENSQGNQLSFHLEKDGGNNTYSYVIDGYANPNAAIWKDMSSTQDTVNLNMKFSFKSDEVEETSSETESSSEEPSSDDSSDDSNSETSSGGDTGETTTPDNKEDITARNGAFTLRIKKSDVSEKPSTVIITYNGTKYDMIIYAYMNITEDAQDYIIEVKEFEGSATGTCPVQVLAGTKVIYETTVTFSD